MFSYYKNWNIDFGLYDNCLSLFLIDSISYGVNMLKVMVSDVTQVRLVKGTYSPT